MLTAIPKGYVPFRSGSRVHLSVMRKHAFCSVRIRFTSELEVDDRAPGCLRCFKGL